MVAASVLASTDTEKDKERQAIAERIKPVGSVYLEGEGAAAQAAKPSGPRTGQQVYQGACFACHGTGALGAPKVHTADWDPRVAKGMDVLLGHALNGFNAMPPKGTCGDCSEAEIKAAIEFMSSKS
ncbi:c-type cytochrome [Gallaecimonas kandeliae]|nr:c-type cytochrome [Gallaecimonas kandeliae]WKE67527.1 c-type cytochrome [Gallaecimonas kandeliae]